ncbi:MAG: hypothetical protein ACRDV3_16480 [Acidothermaceae bacterium]
MPRDLVTTVDRSIGLSTKQAQNVQPPLCDRCGVPMQLRWVDVSATPDVEPRWQLDIVRCLTPDCAARGVHIIDPADDLRR